MVNNRCNLLILIGLVSFFSRAAEPRFSLGGEFDPKRYQATSKTPPLARGNAEQLPTSFSLKHFAPMVGHQGQSGSCVGWSTGYAARSILYNKWANESKPQKPSIAAFSPAWVFNQVKLSSDCEGGSYISDALDLLSDTGALADSEFPYSDTQCFRLPTANESDQANEFTIEHYRRLSSSLSASSLSVNTRKALARGNPVVIGMAVGNTFMNHRGSGPIDFTYSDYETYKTAPYSEFGGHAMAVVGYDDNHSGGAFEIINSWGEDWGNKGFFWLSYKDYQTFVVEAYEVIGPEPDIEPPATPEPNFTLQPSFFHFDGRLLPLSEDNNELLITQSLGSGERFRAELKVQQDSYVYVIGGDHTTSDHVVLFPHQAIASPYIGKNETLLLPGPTEDYFSQLNQTEGKDYFIVLTSAKPIDVAHIAKAMSNQPHYDSIQMRLSEVLGDKLVKTELSNLNSTAYLQKSQIMATVVNINHISAHSIKSDQQPPQIVFTDPEPDINTIATQAIQLITTEEVLRVRGSAQDQSRIKNVTSDQVIQARFSSRGAFQLDFDLSSLRNGDVLQAKVNAVDEHGNAATTLLHIKKQAQ
ncbi:C1 family peptidase [Vibrio sp. MA40-2]|uniref:C1 family peptidase n=1 Tax=Vibrio sp. MA40-2 TaxID=3391828 RepID=UPI0039A697B1